MANPVIIYIYIYIYIVLARENQQKPFEQVAKQIHIKDSTESLTKLPIGDF